MAPTKTWQALERQIAALLSRALGTGVSRNPLSGASNRRDDGTPRPGDVTVPLGYDFLIEAKYRKASAHHKLFYAAVADALKHKLNTQNTFLVTKTHNQRGYLVTMSSEAFEAFLSLPGAKDLLGKRD
jgi:hypothetical protein